MLNQYLGNYLLNHNLVDRDILISLLDENKKAHVKLGVLAIESNLMTAKQVSEVHEMQKRFDKKFGELAVEKGYLKEADVDYLLNQQKVNSIQLSQLLIDHKVFSLEQLEEVLHAYKKENNLTDEQYRLMQKGDLNKILESMIQSQCDPLHIGKTQEYYDYVRLFLRNLVRFIDHQPLIADSNGKMFLEDAEDAIVASQEIYGTYNMVIYLIMKRETFIDFAAHYSKMKINKRDELAEASVAEFLNLNNGLFTINMSEEGNPIMLKPPTILDEADDLVLGSLIQIPIITSIGKLLLAIKPQ